MAFLDPKEQLNELKKGRVEIVSEGELARQAEKERIRKINPCVSRRVLIRHVPICISDTPSYSISCASFRGLAIT